MVGASVTSDVISRGVIVPVRRSRGKSPEGEGPLLRDRRISVRDAPALDTPYARLFAEINPRYADGYTLLILVPHRST